MGLDISAASHLKYARTIPNAKAFDKLEADLLKKGKSLDDVYFMVYPNQRCHRARLGGMKSGLYERTPKSRGHEFRAGSYSYYNWWREELCEFALDTEPEEVWMYPEDFVGRPFVELIDFTDCDGRIGTNVAAKLAADFTIHAARAKRYAARVTHPDSPDDPEVGAGWLQNYRDFARAFRLAAKNGALAFH
jgi:hypothetical protein